MQRDSTTVHCRLSEPELPTGNWVKLAEVDPRCNYRLSQMRAYVSPGAMPIGWDVPVVDSEDVLRNAFECISDYIPHRLRLTDAVHTLIMSISGDDLAACDQESMQHEYFSLVRVLDGLVSARAREAFFLHGLGLTYVEIAGRLSMSIETVQEHVAMSLAVLSLSDVCSHD